MNQNRTGALNLKLFVPQVHKKMKKLFNLENLVYVSVLAMPLYLLRFSFFGIPTNAFEILALACVIWFFSQSRSFKIALRDYKAYWMPICLIMIGLVVSTLLNDEYKIGLGIIKGWFVVPLIFAWVAVETLSSKKIFEAIYQSVFVVACVGLGYFFLGELTYDERLQAFYSSPNFLAMYLAPAIIIGARLWEENKKYYAVSLGIIIISLYLTFSYTAWAAVSLAIMAGFVFEKRAFFKYKKITVILALILAVFLFQLGTSKMDSFLQMEERSSLSSRMMIWKAAEKIVEDNWLWGIGPGNFQAKYLEYQKYFPPYLEWAVPQPHNIFLAFWLQAGLIGLAGFLVLLFLWFRNIWIGNKQEVQIISGLIIAYILLHGLFDTTYLKNDLAVVFWLVVFVGIKKPHLKNEIS